MRRATRGGQGRSSASIERDALVCCVYFLLALAIFVAILASRGGSS